MKCRFEHDGDCCNSGATQYMCKCKHPCDTIVPITKADRIRAMTDEELAAKLIFWDDDRDRWETDAGYIEGDPRKTREKAIQAELAWLRQPEEVG